MGRVRVVTTVHRPPSGVWAVLADYGNVWRASPVVLESRLTSAQSIGVGTTRVCRLTMPGAVVHERVTRWEEDRLIEMESFDGRHLPVRSMTASFRLTPAQEDQTTLEAVMDYTARGGPLSRIIDPVVRGQNEKTLRLFVAGIKHHAETGEDVVPGVRVDLGSVVPQRP